MIVSRRVALRSLFTLTVAAFTGGVLARITTTPRGDRPRAAAGLPAAPGPSAADAEETFDEMYRGRRIQARATPAGVPEVLVDGRPLHLMRCADGGYLTPVDHYASCPTPRAATRAAVDQLGSAPLSPLAASHGARGDHGAGPGGSPRGVHA
ncbi:tyrosinase family oxidase copper chaperone [Streptomyces sp. NPDC008121]|uniref:tyrosinase family oxidase copper chaperone n=1 Tax=Streptomyces sp. NPDC008121 TaxID=3364809 RepID=UPI0036E41E27